MRVDCHIHTPLCGHADGRPEEYVAAAARAGIDLLTFTCHVPMEDEGFGGNETRMRATDLPVYFDMVESARLEGRRLGVEVCCGIEAEIFPDRTVMERMAATLRNHPFDFIVGALHHDLPAYQRWLREHEIVEEGDIIRSYFAHLCDAARSGLYHSIGHPGRLLRRGRLGKPSEAASYQSVIKEFLQTAAESGVCVEINTNEGAADASSDAPFLKWAGEAGVRLTLGSDAHAPQYVGRNLDRAMKTLDDCGVVELYYFREGGPRTFPTREGGRGDTPAG